MKKQNSKLSNRNGFHGNRRSRKRLVHNTFNYEALEPRQVLASLFPTYIDGQFTLGNGPDAATPYELANTFELESNPTATKTIYLDFDGHHSVNNQWGHDIVFPAFNREGSASSFSDSELIEIQLQFQNVAEDFLAFDVNVTTKDPGVDALARSDNGDQFYGIRAVNTQATDGFGNGIGGVAYLNSFDNENDDPVFSFNKGENNGAMTNSHEIGHALGLYHDGLGGSTYHPGTGSGETSWGPIMGAPFGENVTQWSNGDYENSTQTEDDYSVITSSANGFDFRQDLVGNTFAAAADLNPAVDGSVFDWNIIERNTDVDVFTFEAGGDVSLAINAFDGRPNLDILARIYDSTGNLVAENNPESSVNASFDLTLENGRYYLAIEGVGKEGVYSDYGSIGLFTVEGTIQPIDDGGTGEAFVVGETGRLVATGRWITVSLNHTYENPVVITGPASTNDSDPLLVRVRNVTSESFQIRLNKWDFSSSSNGSFSVRNVRVPISETVDYLVVEKGEHVLSDGSILVAGVLEGQTDIWSENSLGDAFAGGSRPALFSQIMTENDNAVATTRMQFTSDSEFQIKLSEQESNDQSHAAETVGFIAIQAGSGTTGDSLFEVIVTPDSVTHNDYDLEFNGTLGSTPALFAKMQTYDGSDTATIRYRNLDSDGARIFIEEERSQDSEVRHTTEVVGALAIEFGDIVAFDAGNSGLPPGSPIELRPGFAGITTPASSELWNAVRVQQSWEEMTLSIDHQDFEFHHHDDHEFHDHELHHHDHDEADMNFRQNAVLVGAQTGFATNLDKQESDIESPNRFDIGQKPLQLAGAIEVERSENFAASQISDKSKADASNIDEVDDAFALGFDLLF